MNRIPTIVIHGFLTPRTTNLPVHLTLRRRGQQTFDVPIPGLNTQSIARSSEDVERTVHEVRRTTGASRVNLVGVSMGGVIAVHYVRVHAPDAPVRRTVTLGSPFNGAELAGAVGKLPLPIPAAGQMAPGSDVIQAIRAAEDSPHDIVSIWAEGDAVVPEQAAHLPGARNLKAPIGSYPIAHYQLVIDPRNLAFMADRLLESR